MPASNRSLDIYDKFRVPEHYRDPNITYANKIVEERTRGVDALEAENAVPIWNAEQESFYRITHMEGDIPRSKELLKRQITLQDLGHHLTNEFYRKPRPTPTAGMTSPHLAPDEEHYNLLAGDLPTLADQDAIVEMAEKDLLNGQGPQADGTTPQQENDLNNLNSIKPNRGDVPGSYDGDRGRMTDGLAMGEADVLNPHFQFNELDDVRSDPNYTKIGRLYGERIYNFNLPKIQFIVGQLKFKLNAVSMISGNRAQTEEVVSYLRSNGAHPIRWGFRKLKALVISMFGFLTGRFMSGKGDMYEFVPAPKVYMRYVNEILNELAVYMDLAKSPLESPELDPDYTGLIADIEPRPDAQTNINSILETVEKNVDKFKNTIDTIVDTVKNTISGFEELLSVTVPLDEKEIKLREAAEAASKGISSIIDDIQGSDHYMGKSTMLHVYRILPGTHKMLKRNLFADFIKSGNFSVNESVDFISQHFEQMMQIQYIPFMLEKGAQVNESISNSTGEHPAIGKMNSTSSQAQNDSTAMFFDNGLTSNLAEKFGNLKSAINNNDGLGVVSAVGQAVDPLVRAGIRTAQGKMGEYGLVMNGNARMAFPEVWNDSSFERTCSLSFKLFSPYGNRLAIFENIYVPLVFLIAMALPKAIGPHAYMTPFVVRTVAKGLFTCDLGIISSISIARGDEATRTVEGFYRQMNVSIELKDLLPKINMSIDGGAWGFMSVKNVGFHSYLRTLANIDIEDNMAIKQRIQWLFEFLNGKYSLENIGLNFRTNIAQSRPFQIITYIGKAWLGLFPSRANSIQRLPGKSAPY
jgi:hypothetical protein